MAPLGRANSSCPSQQVTHRFPLPGLLSSPGGATLLFPLTPAPCVVLPLLPWGSLLSVYLLSAVPSPPTSALPFGGFLELLLGAATLSGHLQVGYTQPLTYQQPQPSSFSPTLCHHTLSTSLRDASSTLQASSVLLSYTQLGSQSVISLLLFTSCT